MFLCAFVLAAGVAVHAAAFAGVVAAVAATAGCRETRESCRTLVAAAAAAVVVVADKPDTCRLC